MARRPLAGVRVEPVEAPDLDRLAGIHERSFARRWSADELADLLRQPGTLCLAASRTGLIGRRATIGFVLLRSVADEAEVLTVAVEPRFRGRGVGRLLMERATARLWQEAIRTLFLEVDEANAPALALYRSLGFQEVGRRRGYYAGEGGGAALVLRVHLR